MNTNFGTILRGKNLRRGGATLLIATSIVGVGAVSTGAQAAAPTVDESKVVLAAELDPAKNSEDPTPGAKVSVQVVEKALADQHLLDPGKVDGHFGTDTVVAYGKWQEKQGASGQGANGLPADGSLQALAQASSFKVSHPITLGNKVQVDGQTVNQRTADMLAEAKKRSGVDFTLVQGSYHPGTGASAGTHDGGGVVDVDGESLSAGDRAKVVQAMREVGFAAWDRTGVADFSSHIHAAAIADTDMDSSAWGADANRQIFDYYNGMDGLGQHGKDNGPNVKKVTWEEYKGQ